MEEPLEKMGIPQHREIVLQARAEEAALAKEAVSVGTIKDEADTAAKEKEFAKWAGFARGSSRRRCSPPP